MNLLPSCNPFPQLFLLEFYDKHYKFNPTNIVQLKYFQLNVNYSQKMSLISQTMDQQQHLTAFKSELVNCEKKNSCDRSNITSDTSNFILIFQPKSRTPRIDDKLLRESLDPSKDVSSTKQQLVNSVSSAPCKKPTNENRSHCQLFNRHRCYTNLRRRISVFWKWLRENGFTIWLKRNYKMFCQWFGSMGVELFKSKEKFFNTLSINCANNEYSLNVIGSKITSVIQELHQIRQTNEETSSALKQEIRVLQDCNKTLTNEMKNISNILENISMNLKLIVSRPTKSIPVVECLAPPPPPPMPSPPPCFSLPTAPISAIKETKICPPTGKLLITAEKQRPSITVEDLLKVTLKKAPQTRGKENERKSEAQRFGPVVTMDMLKKIKLKSIKCKTNDNVRLPLHTLENNQNKNHS